MSTQSYVSSQLQSVTLQSQRARLKLLNYGATTQDWRVSDRGEDISMILGFDDPSDYLRSPYYFGTIAGRVSNRIGSARYPTGDGDVILDKNEGPTTLHGGSRSLSRVFWDLRNLSDTQARFTYVSPAGEMGFPGQAHINVLVSLTDHQLRYDITATVDCETPISLAQHNYYNFGGTGDIWDYQIKSPAHHVLEQDALGVSTGKILDTSGGPLDLRTHTHLRGFARMRLDAHFVFDHESSEELREVADMRATNGRGIKIISDQAGAQIYTGHGLPEISGGLDQSTYGPASGLCFEPQGYPNAVNIPSFPSIMVTPDRPYRQSLIIEATGIDK